MTDRECMEEAVKQARSSKSEPGRISPKVGCLVKLKSQKIITSHRGEDASGKDHAEYRALEIKEPSSDFADATVFTTLEPCYKRGFDKIPCVDRLIRRKVSRVFIGMLDPDPTVHGKGQMKLIEHNIHVGMFDPDLTSQIQDLNREFIQDRKTPRFTIDKTESIRTHACGTITFTGKYRLKPTGDDRMAVFTRRGKNYFPQQRNFVIHNDGTWECSIHVKDPGTEAFIVAEIDPGTLLWVELYEKVVRELNKWVGLPIESLPPSVRMNDSIVFNVI